MYYFAQIGFQSELGFSYSYNWQAIHMPWLKDKYVLSLKKVYWRFWNIYSNWTHYLMCTKIAEDHSTNEIITVTCCNTSERNIHDNCVSTILYSQYPYDWRHLLQQQSQFKYPNLPCIWATLKEFNLFTLFNENHSIMDNKVYYEYTKYIQIVYLVY